MSFFGDGGLKYLQERAAVQAVKNARMRDLLGWTARGMGNGEGEITTPDGKIYIVHNLDEESAMIDGELEFRRRTATPSQSS